MAFMGVLLVMGIFSIAVLILLFWVAVFMVAGLLEGILVLRTGKTLGKNELVQTKRPGFTKACKILGILAIAICGAAALSVVLLPLLPILTQMGDIYTSPAGDTFMQCAFVLVVLGFLLFWVMGVMLTRIAGLNRHMEEPPVHKALSVTCRVLSIINFVAGTLAVLTIGVIMLLVPWK